jgi:plasmid stabilization system protein ParE
MPKPWRLTRAAETSLIDIADWTVVTFGPRQAAAYEEDLIARCAEIAAGTALSQDCRRLIDPTLPEDLRFARAGQHFVVLIEDAEQVIIIDFLHNRADLPQRLANLPARRNNRDHSTTRQTISERPQPGGVHSPGIRTPRRGCGDPQGG